MNPSAPWNDLSYIRVRELYDQRFSTHSDLLTAFHASDIHNYMQLALGIADPSGNYSAYRHGLGPQILHLSRPEQVFDLAGKLFECKSPEEIPTRIYKANLPYLKISVGSEMAAMLRPDVFWVTNVRTLWSHLVLKHNGNVSIANEELRLYKSQDKDSEMDYQTWKDLHSRVGPSLARIASLGSQEALNQNVPPGDLKYLWADAIADTMYNEFAGLQ